MRLDQVVLLAHGIDDATTLDDEAELRAAALPSPPGSDDRSEATEFADTHRGTKAA